MDVREIVAEYLKAHGYDGLCGDDCGCIAADLGPCGEACCFDCEPGVLLPCPVPECGEHDWHIGPKPAEGGKGEG